jgi:hypothetical protein
MAKYRLKKEHYLQDKKAKVEPQLHEKGAVIDWEGTPSLHMEPIDKQAKERVEARVADFGEKRKEAMARHGVRVGWTPTFEKNMANIITRPEPGEDAPAQSTSGSAARNGKRKAA